MDKIKTILTAMAMIGYFVMGFVQLGAIYTFFADHWGWYFIFAGPAAFIVAGIPLVGAFAGVLTIFLAHCSLCSSSTYWWHRCRI
jgi:hypothetical protein